MKQMKKIFAICAVSGLCVFCARAADAQEIKSIVIDIESLPSIEELSSNNESFSQYESAVQDDNMARASGRERDFLLFKYEVQKGDTLFTISSRCCIRYDTIATINSISSINDNIAGRTLILPVFNAVFIAVEPKSDFEMLIANDGSLEEYVAKSNNLCYNVNGRLFIAADNAMMSPTARAFFLAAKDLFKMPVDGAYVSSRYGWRVSPITGKQKFHGGIDLAVREGTEVHPCSSGTVKTCKRDDKVYGNYIVLDHEGGITSLYAHLKDILTKERAEVSCNTVIGRVGHTGMATGPHLHFEIRTNGKSSDPKKVLGG